MLKKANISWSAKQITKSVNKKIITFDNIVQRSYVWEKWRKSNLIHSMVFGYPIPPFYAARSEAGTYDMFDGQQRMTTIASFINDEWQLDIVPPVQYEDDKTGDMITYDMSGKSFSELPEEIRDSINSYNLLIYYYEDITQAEIVEMFKRLNSGKPLSTKSRALASCQDLEGLLEIGKHEIFDAMLSERARANKSQAIIVMKACCMLNMSISDISFESRKFNEILENYIMTDEQKSELIALFDFIIKIHEALIERGYKIRAKKLYTETHFISLIPYLNIFRKNNEDIESGIKLIIAFFTEDKQRTTVSDDYNAAALKGAAKTASIEQRDNAIRNIIENLFKSNSGENDIVVDAVEEV